MKYQKKKKIIIIKYHYQKKKIIIFKMKIKILKYPMKDQKKRKINQNKIIRI